MSQADVTRVIRACRAQPLPLLVMLTTPDLVAKHAPPEEPGKDSVQTARILDGNEAAAWVAYRLNEVIAIYPITDSPQKNSPPRWPRLSSTNLSKTHRGTTSP